MHAVRIEGLVKRYGGRAVVDGLTVSVAAGEVFALLGPNGAGKTTTIEIAEGFRRPDAGSVEVLGLDPRRRRRALSARIGVMPQEASYYTSIRPAEALTQFAAFYDRPERPADMLRLVGLEGVRTTWRRLSGGERQRLSLAMALVGRPELAFLDEPTAGLDAHARASTWDLIRSLPDRGATVVLTTHLLDEAERLADRVAIVHRGRLVALGTPTELRASRAGIRFRAAPALRLGELGAIEEAPGAYLVPGESSPDAVARITQVLARHGVAITDLSVGARSLEEVFLELTADARRDDA